MHNSKNYMSNHKLYFYLLICLLLFNNNLFANMANPYIKGTQNSLFIGSKDVSVTKETIDIELEKNLAKAAYTVTYDINSDINSVLPLLFIASNYEHDFKVVINGNIYKDPKVLKKITTAEIKKEFSFLKLMDNERVEVPFSETETASYYIDDLISFNADLKKGKNTIVVSYFALNAYNRHNWYKKPTIEYSLYPSKFWKSFENISINIHSETPFKIDSSNIGMPMNISKNEYNTFYSWQLKSITLGALSIQVSPKISKLSSILIAMEPFGIAVLILIVLIILHIKYLIAESKNETVRFNKPLWYGNLIVPLVFVLAFLFSFSLIDWTLGENAGRFHGYTFLIIFALPVFWIGYALFMWLSYKLFFLLKNR